MMLSSLPELGQDVAVDLHLQYHQVAAVTSLRPLVMSAVTTATVHIDGKILTITEDTGCEHLVLEAREVLDKHFNFDSNEAALLGPDTPSPALAAVEELENSSQVCEVAAVASNDGCAVAELTETQEEAALPAQVVTSPALVTAVDTGAEERDTNAGAEDTEASTGDGSVEAALASVEAVEAERVARAEDMMTEETEAVTESSYGCKQCGKTFATAKKRDDHKRNHIKKLCSLCGKEFKADNFKRHQKRCREKFDARSEVVAEQVEVAAAVPVVASPSTPSSLHTEVVRVETGDQDRVEMETEELGVGVRGQDGGLGEGEAGEEGGDC